MGKKGFSRKAFLKPSTQNVDDEEPAPSHEPKTNGTETLASQDSTKAGVNGTDNKDDPSNKFLVDDRTQDSKENRAQEKGKASEFKRNEDVQEGNQVSADLGQDLSETRGQMLQRHKKELKAHKDVAKKMGKKRKDEAEQIEKNLEDRHRQEIKNWEQANPDLESEKDKTVLSTTSGLYDLKIGGEDEKETKKPTKAQKRREQREKEEAEREARIAEEQANVGPSDREIELAELNGVLEQQGLSVVDIPPDGHCMYRSIQDQLRLKDPDSEQDVQQLRIETASYIRAFPDEFYPFVIKEESEKDQDAQIDEYCTTIEDKPSWGGQVELQALAQALEKEILIYSVGMPIVQLGKEYKGKSEALQLCYLRHAYGLGEHYNSTMSSKSVKPER